MRKEQIALKTMNGPKLANAIIYNELLALVLENEEDAISPSVTHIPTGLRIFSVPGNRLNRTKQALKYLVSIFKPETYPDFMQTESARLSQEAIDALEAIYTFLTEACCDCPKCPLTAIEAELPEKYFNIKNTYMIKGVAYNKAIIGSIIASTMSDNEHLGLCLSCSYMQPRTEPGVKNRLCNNCGKSEVYGAEVIALYLN